MLWVRHTAYNYLLWISFPYELMPNAQIEESGLRSVLNCIFQM